MRFGEGRRLSRDHPFAMPHCSDKEFKTASLMIDSLLLATTRVLTFKQGQRLTNASGFFFERHGKLFLVTSRHVLMDKPSQHFPDCIEIELHTDPDNTSKSIDFSILYIQRWQKHLAPRHR